MMSYLELSVSRAEFKRVPRLYVRIWPSYDAERHLFWH